MERIRKGFKVAPDGSILAKYGSESFPCGGIAQIQVSIEATTNSKIKFVLSEEIKSKYIYDDSDICTAKDIPTCYRSAIFAGAEETYLKANSSEGIEFTLISAFVHPTDTNEMVFKYTGKIALAGWYQLQLDSDIIS